MQQIPRAVILLGLAALHSLAITIQASRVFDGKGGVLQNVRITVEGTKVLSVEPGRGGSADYNLTDVTVMPGWIDTHVHIGWHFNKEGRADTSKETPTEFAINATGNAYVTLMAGSRLSKASARRSTLTCVTRSLVGLYPGPESSLLWNR